MRAADRLLLVLFPLANALVCALVAPSTRRVHKPRPLIPLHQGRRTAATLLPRVQRLSERGDLLADSGTAYQYIDTATALRKLLDETVLLSYRRHEDSNDGVRSTDWMAGQLNSLVGYLATCLAMVPEDTTKDPGQLAVEIDQQLLRRHGVGRDPAATCDGDGASSSTTTLEELVQLYGQLHQWRKRQESLTAELEAVQHQLVAWKELIESVAQRSATSSYDAFPKRQSSTALYATRSEGIDIEISRDETLTGETLLDVKAEEDHVDVAIVGAGIAGLCAGAILNTLYNKKVRVYESHYLPGGCAHAFDRRAENGVTFTFDSGPTILLGCSSPPFNALRQVLNAIGQDVEWVPYDGWGMIENPGKFNEARWRVDLGPLQFEDGPLRQFGGPNATQEFRSLKEVTKNLLAGVEIPALAMRPGPQALVPLLRYFRTLVKLISQGELTTGTFAPFMDGPQFIITDPWLRSWLDALAFSLSGLPASRTAAAAMAFVLYDMHRPGAALDYPKGGMGAVCEALRRGVEAGRHGSRVHLRQHVQSIDCSEDGLRITGLTLRSGKRVKAKLGVICNAPVWSLRGLIDDDRVLSRLSGGKRSNVTTSPSVPQSWTVTDEGSSIQNARGAASDLPPSVANSILPECDSAEQTGSFLHLHLALNASGLDLDNLEAHYTVMDRGLSGDGRVVNGIPDGPCGELNMIAVSNPCVIDRELAPEGFIVLHAYGAGNEPYDVWRDIDRGSEEYRQRKADRAQVLWRAVESVIPDARDRTVIQLVGSPLTHEQFLRRPRGTYGSATEDYLRDGSTPYDSLVIANDGVFPGIGVPAVCISGASAANSFVSVYQQWQCLDQLQRDGKLL